MIPTSFTAMIKLKSSLVIQLSAELYTVSFSPFRRLNAGINKCKEPLV